MDISEFNSGLVDIEVLDEDACLRKREAFGKQIVPSVVSGLHGDTSIFSAPKGSEVGTNLNRSRPMRKGFKIKNESPMSQGPSTSFLDGVDTCDECKVEAEDSIHFFWRCTRAKDMWSSSKLIFPNILDQLSFFKEIIWCLMMDEKCATENIELILTYAWVLWGNKNEIRHGGKRKDGR
nr:hypothetical protein CFP56_64480 [Quercus suber]